MATISVCLTHYNRAQKLADTLESLARQTLMPDEVFVWDDKSPVDPEPVVMQFRHRFHRLVYHRNVENLGMPGNLNAVLAQATGQYVANLHDADIFDPRLLEKWARALDQNPTAGMVFCGLKTIDKQTGKQRDTIIDAQPLTPGRQFFREKLAGNLSCPIWGTAMVRKSVHDALLPLDARFKNWADIDYWMRIALRFDIAYLPEALIILDNTDTAERRFSWFRVLILHETYITNINRHFSDDKIGRARALYLQVKFLRRRYFVLLLRTLRNRDWQSSWTGLRLISKIFKSQTLTEPEALTAMVKPNR